MKDLKKLIDQLNALGQQGRAGLVASDFESAKDSYIRAFEREQVKKGKVLLRHYEHLLQSQTELLQQLEEINTELDQLQSETTHRLTLENGVTLDCDISSGQYFHDFMRAVDSVRAGKSVSTDAGETQIAEAAEAQELVGKTDASKDSKASKDSADSTPPGSESRSEGESDTETSLDELEKLLASQTSSGSAETGSNPHTAPSPNDPQHPSLYDPSELSNESDELLSLL